VGQCIDCDSGNRGTSRAPFRSTGIWRDWLDQAEVGRASAPGLVMSREYRRLVCLVYGQTGSGKTILARALLAKRIKTLGPAAVGLIVDTLQEHYDVPALALPSLPDYLRIKAGRPRTVRLLLDTESDFDTLSELLEFRDSSAPVALMIDEVSYWTSPGRSTPGLSRLIRYGRHWRVDLIGVARRPAETSRELSAQATRLYVIGKVVEPRDVDYLSRILPAGAMSKSMSLAEFHYLNYSTSGTYVVCPPVKIIEP